MKLEKINQLFADTAYIRTGGSAEELKCAEYLKAQCAELGLEAHLEEFEVDMADMKKAVLTIDGKEYPCEGYRGAGCGEVEAPFYYKPNSDAYSLQECKGTLSDKSGNLLHSVSALILFLDPCSKNDCYDQSYDRCTNSNHSYSFHFK